MRIISIAIVVLMVLGMCSSVQAQALGYELIGPITAQRLTVYFIKTQETPRQPYVTLEQALASGRAIIRENNSQSLVIENLSDTALFVQSSDIIKGGQQDRMIAEDRIVAAHASEATLHTYCVEHDRSFKRGNEPIETFSASREMAPLHHLRTLARHELTSRLLTPSVGGVTAPDPEMLRLLDAVGGVAENIPFDDIFQDAVWSDVASVQKNLTSVLRDSVTKNASPSSLQLALESRTLSRAREDYEAKLDKGLQNAVGVTGIVYAIDGRIMGAEIYASRDLFLRMWPKLARSIATEAIQETTKKVEETAAAPEEAAFEEYLSFRGAGKTVEHSVNDRTLMTATENARSFLFESFDLTPQKQWVHRSLVTK